MVYQSDYRVLGLMLRGVFGGFCFCGGLRLKLRFYGCERGGFTVKYGQNTGIRSQNSAFLECQPN